MSTPKRWTFTEAGDEELDELRRQIETLPEGPRRVVMHGLDRHWTTICLVANEMIGDGPLSTAEWVGALVVLSSIACRAEVKVVPMSKGGKA